MAPTVTSVGSIRSQPISAAFAVQSKHHPEPSPLGSFGAKTPIQRQRLHDCGIALVFSAILVRVVTQDRPLGVFEWALFFIGPLFIAAALWRLARTS